MVSEEVLVKIRPMVTDDIEGILAIDRKITGALARAETFHLRVDSYLATDPLVCRVAEVDGKIIGFILGDIKGWEHGVSEAGSIEVVGVDLDYQRNDVARKLAESVFEHFRRLGMKHVYTSVNWADGPLLSYFKSLGFKRSDQIKLEKDL